MHPSERLLQNVIDGEANSDELAAFERMQSANPSLMELHKQLSDLDLTAKSRAKAVTAEHTANSVAIAQIMTSLDTVEPRRRMHVELGTAVATLLVSTACAAGYGIAGTMDDLLPLTWIAAVSVIAGLLVIIGLGRLRHRQDEDLSISGRLRKPTPPGFMTRLFGYRVALGDGERLLYRAFGCILLIGGCYLAIRGLI